MRRVITSLILLLVAASLAACGQVETELTGDLIVPVVQQAVQIIPTTIPETESLPEEARPLDECVVCHSDKEMLIEVAKPEVVAEAESSGVG